MAEPGWYDDPRDPTLARWYDGEHWTEHTIVKASWAGPGTPPPPVEPQPTVWTPAPRPSSLPAPPPLPTPAATTATTSLADRYRSWPRWARIAVPVAAGFLVLGAIGSLTEDEDSGDRQVEASDAAETDDAPPSIGEAAGDALLGLDADVSRSQMVALVRELCDADERGAARQLVGISSEPGGRVAVLDAAGEAAEESCPEVTGDEPGLLNAVLAAAGRVPTSTTAAPTSTTALTTSSGPTQGTTATTRAPVQPRSTAPPAPQPLVPQPPATQPPATQPPATQPPAPSCHPSYSGCLDPNASDYDCAGGGGNGPYYTGRVEVYGPDPFGLDNDGDGIGCDNS